VPVVEIRALPQPDDVVQHVLAAATHAVADALGEEPRGTWATWEEIQPGRYSEGEAPAQVQPYDTHPPLVRVTAFEGRTDEQIAAMLKAAAAAIAGELGIDPGNVFAVYDEARSGRIFTGGGIVRRP
jgi:phenylpyruvate tautomerase PptA (4-oxalocrotonate tautomerase family)